MRSATRSSLIISTSPSPATYSACARPVSVAGSRSGSPCSCTIRHAVGVGLLLVGVLEELVGDRAGDEALGHEVVPLVAQHADELGREHVVEDVDDALAVRPVGVGDRPAV